ncbi:hypothetical protein [Vibrio sp. D431a]|uniref:hypothetical protein n=1 Tax=Vibrio sp. D431a TaxID=2837388 RepID=UPI00255684EF|nr:hypothetical protein [Vibrio sp. D431a]MDK9789828.1 hypothetical protein [Vibrio sp. D431a]
METKLIDEDLHLLWYSVGQCIKNWNITSVDKLHAILINIDLNMMSIMGSTMCSFNKIIIEPDGTQKCSALIRALEGKLETFSEMFEFDKESNTLGFTKDGIKHLECEDYSNNRHAVSGAVFDLFKLTILPKQQSLFQASLEDIREANLKFIGDAIGVFTLIEICKAGNFDEDVLEGVIEEESIQTLWMNVKGRLELKECLDIL